MIERAVLVGAGEARHLDELARLAGTLGVEVVGRLEQGRRDFRGYLGSGKREELNRLIEEKGAGTAIIDDELTASQARVLERVAGVPVVDRTELIIRIFESHARDAASRLEVELADLEYRLPRVKGRNEALSRLGGGGRTTRGPGEQQLEYDRRVIRERMRTIGRRLQEERAARAVRNSRLKQAGPPKVALVGYTNAGKTTILNTLSGERRSTADRLFETLETTTRVVDGGTGENGSAVIVRPDFVLTDTVGFIRKLPAQLVHSFASTLEAARDADVVVLCADAASEELEDEVRSVRRTLCEALGEEVAQRAVLCLTKVDLVSPLRIEQLRAEYPGMVEISARRGEVGPLLERIYETISAGRRRMELLIPHAEYGAASRLYGRAEIHTSENTAEGVRLDVTLPPRLMDEYAPYSVA
jgi:GTPase